MINENLLKMLVCPVSKGELEYDQENQELICATSGLIYPIHEGIPVMIKEEARKIDG